MEERLKEGLKKIKWVVLDCAYDTWEKEITQSLFLKIISLKLSGYCSDYPYGVLPIDTNDFIGTHHLICEERKNGLYPIMGYKSTTLSRAKTFNLTFPGLSILLASNANEHANVVREILKRCEENGTEISYDGSWTIDPELRKDKEYAAYLKKIMSSINVLYHLNENIPEVIGFGMIRFKTHEYFQYMGYEPIEFNGKPLPPLRMSTLQNEPAILLHLKKFTDIAVATTKQFEFLWNERIVISDVERRKRSTTKQAA